MNSENAFICFQRHLFKKANDCSSDDPFFTNTTIPIPTLKVLSGDLDFLFKSKTYPTEPVTLLADLS